MQQGGSPYGALPPQPQMQQSSELPSSFQGMAMAEAAPPITSLPPPPPPPSTSSVPTFEELATGDDPLEGGSGGSGGNRWPRQETLALLKIRSDMDAAFKDATLKGPLWEDVSRKLAELGYKRNAKKCKEKFENVHKYYKRTKEGRAGRQDGKSYRFFSQLEALHSSTVSSPRPVTINLNPPPPMTTTNTNPNIPRPIQAQNPATSAPMPITSVPPPPVQLSSVPSPNMFSHNVQYPPAAKPSGFSSNSSSSSSGSESDDEQTEDLPMSGKKRKRESESGSKKMMAFFEGLMRQVMERQETMQKKFLEAIEKREQDRMIREEAWRRQEITRMAREHELAAQERAAAASRDAAIISFLQKVTGQTVQVPSPNASTMPSTVTVTTQQPPPSQTPPPPPPPPSQVHQQTPQLPPQQPPPPQQTPPPPQQQQQQQQQRSQDIVMHQYQTTPPANTEMMTMRAIEEGSGGMTGTSTDPASSRWPKAEVHALIQLRSGLDSRYQETGPKGPLWEEISAGMRRLGYNRNAKRCKEKWENINKYFKKVKESNKQRPEDAKTCPYFHQLDALYRSKHNSTSGGSGSGLLQLTHPNPNPNQNQNPNPNPNPNPSPISMMAPPQLAGDNDQTNGGARANFFGQTTTGVGAEGSIMKKPEDIVRELMEQTNNNEYGNDPESDNMDEDDEDDEDGEDDEEEEGNGQYRIQFQRQNNVSNSNNNGGGNGTPTQNTSGNSTGSFLAMVR